MLGNGVREGEMLSPVLEPRKVKAARWEIEVVKQQPSGAEEQSKQPPSVQGGREPESVFLSLLKSPSSGRSRECFPSEPQITLCSALDFIHACCLGCCATSLPPAPLSGLPSWIGTLPKSLSLSLEGPGDQLQASPQG